MNAQSEYFKFSSAAEIKCDQCTSVAFFSDELNETEEEMLVLIIKTFKIFNCVTCFSLKKKAQQIHISTDLIRQLALHCFI